jgi:hypothetical protein
MNKLDGWKTYICILLLIISGVLKHFGIVDSELYSLLISVLGPLSLASLRSGVKKAEIEMKKQGEQND